MGGRLVWSTFRWSALAAVLLATAFWIQTRDWPSVAFAQQGGAASERRPLS